MLLILLLLLPSLKTRSSGIKSMIRITNRSPKLQPRFVFYSAGFSSWILERAHERGEFGDLLRSQV
jgi:hypothetical protein